MKVTSKTEVLINLGDYQHLSIEVSVTDRRQENESKMQAIERVNGLAHQGLLKQMDVLLLKQSQRKRDEAYALVGIDAATRLIAVPDYNWKAEAQAEDDTQPDNDYFSPDDGLEHNESSDNTDERQHFLGNYAGTISEFVDDGSRQKLIELRADAYLSNPDQAYISSYHWDVGEKADIISSSTTNSEIEVSFPIGLHVVTLTTTDEGGDEQKYQIHVVINDDSIPF